MDYLGPEAERPSSPKCKTRGTDSEEGEGFEAGLFMNDVHHALGDHDDDDDGAGGNGWCLNHMVKQS